MPERLCSGRSLQREVWTPHSRAPYLRNGNQTLELTGADLTRWIRRRGERSV